MAGPLVLGRRSFTLWMAAAGGTLLVGCPASEEDSDGDSSRTPAVLGALTAVKLTTDRVIVPAHPRADKPDTRNPGKPGDKKAMLADGLGDYDFGPGEPVRPRMPDGSTPPASGPNAKRLTRFVHVTDIHIADDESPDRLAAFDAPKPMDGADRPQAAYQGRILNAAVRTVNGLHKSLPLDFVLLGGDTVDSAQKNELSWALDILSGAPVVALDSGVVNDPVPGSNNDPKDPFVAEGLQVPWRFCMGNHDVLVMGVNPVGPTNISAATGTTPVTGTRDYSKDGAPVTQNEVPADPDRRPQTRAEVIGAVSARGDGHGLKQLIDPNRVNYVFDVDGTPLRFVVYDTACENGGADGIVHQRVVESFLRPALEDAKRAGKWVIVASHHGLGSLGDGSFGTSDDKAQAVKPSDLLELFCTSGVVIMSITGHTHQNVISWWDAGNDRGLWEVQTSSLVEFPNWMRLVEVTDEDNGYVSIQLVGLEFATDDDPVAAEGRKMAVLDYVIHWGDGDPGQPEDRNVKLYAKKPAESASG